MNHREVYNWFEKCFPDYACEKVTEWFQNGKNSIRVRHANGREYVFTHDGHKCFKFESVENYLKSMEKGIK